MFARYADVVLGRGAAAEGGERAAIEEVLCERENVFSLLRSTDDHELKKKYRAFSLDPRTRYKRAIPWQDRAVAYDSGET